MFDLKGQLSRLSIARLESESFGRFPSKNCFIFGHQVAKSATHIAWYLKQGTNLLKRTIEAKRMNICSFCAIIHLRSSLLIDLALVDGQGHMYKNYAAVHDFTL